MGSVHFNAVLCAIYWVLGLCPDMNELEVMTKSTSVRHSAL